MRKTTKRTRRVKPSPATMPTDDAQGVYVRVPVSPELAGALQQLVSAFDGISGIVRSAAQAVGVLEREGRRLRGRRRP